MEWVETTGRSVQEAKEAALDELGVDEADAEFEVLAEAQTGLFGRLRSEARVRARVRPTAPRSKDDRRDRRDRRRKAGAPAEGETASTAAPAGGTTTADSPASDEAASGPGGGNGSRGGSRGGRSRSRSGSETSAGSGAATRSDAPTSDVPASDVPASDVPASDVPASGVSASDVPAPGTAASEAPPGGVGGRRPAAGTDDSEAAGGGRRNPSRNRRRQPNRPVTGAPTGAQRAEAELADDDSASAKGQGVEVDLDRQAEVAVEFLKQLTAEFGLEATVSVARPDEDTVELQLSGHDLGILIGPKGATLLAVQNLVRTVVFNETGGNNGHINVDVGGYRQKRSEALARFATQVANSVKQSGARTVLEPMSAVDRKVVHDTISAIDGVSTISEGEEPRRRVVVLPG